MAKAMERAGWELDDLPPYQRTLFDDLCDPLDEEALAEMLSYWHFDLEKLFERGRQGWGAGRAPAKPQIDVWVEVTSKGNLKAEWLPRGASIHYTPPGSDFTWFYRQESRTVAYGGRPSNELFFLHDFNHAHGHINYPTDLPTAALDTPLLAACAKVVERLKERLAYHFDVRMRTDVVVEWGSGEQDSDEHPWWRFEDTLLTWEIVDPEERQKSQELEELADLEARLGFSEAALLEAKERLETRVKGATGPAPAPHTLSERLARELKKQGLPATKGKVERAMALIERHRPPAQSSGPADNVVSLRPPQSEG